MELHVTVSMPRPERPSRCKALNSANAGNRESVRPRSNIAKAMAASTDNRTSQIRRKGIEEVFGWVEIVTGMAKTRHEQ